MYAIRNTVSSNLYKIIKLISLYTEISFIYAFSTCLSRKTKFACRGTTLKLLHLANGLNEFKSIL